MTVTPHLEECGEQPFVYTPIEATLSEWGQVNALVLELFGWLAECGIPPAGALTYRYLVVGDEDNPYRLEVGAPVDGPVIMSRIHISAIRLGSGMSTPRLRHGPHRGESNSARHSAEARKSGKDVSSSSTRIQPMSLTMRSGKTTLLT